MTTFDELRADYAQWRQRHMDYEMNCMRFAHRFCTQFGKYLEAPESYKDSKDNLHWYVQPMQAKRDDAGQYSFKEPVGLPDALTKCDDGLWASGLRLTLDINPRTFPKTQF